MKPSQMLYLDSSNFDDISSDGSIKILVEILHNFGLIDKDVDRNGHYELDNNIGDQKLRIYGDCLLMEKF